MTIISSKVPPKATRAPKEAASTQTDAAAFHEISYERHADKADVSQPFRDGVKSFDHIFDPNFVSAYMHQRTIQRLSALLERFPGSEWLTVGDDSWGRDAYFLNRNGARALPSGLSREFADLAIAAGHFTEFAVENAEALSFEDRSFDFVLCKHSFHHFPRPFVAFDEMLRVSRKGIVLIEPAETGFDHYEPVGNYLYRVCLREIEKAARGVNLPSLAVGWDHSEVPLKMGNVRIDTLGEQWETILSKMEKADRLLRSLPDLREFYAPLHFNTFASGGHLALINQLRVLAKRLLSQSLWRARPEFNHPRNMVVVIFKCPLSADFKARLKVGDFTVIDLGPNPYIGPDTWGPPI